MERFDRKSVVARHDRRYRLAKHELQFVKHKNILHQHSVGDCNRIHGNNSYQAEQIALALGQQLTTEINLNGEEKIKVKKAEKFEQIAEKDENYNLQQLNVKPFTSLLDCENSTVAVLNSNSSSHLLSLSDKALTPLNIEKILYIGYGELLRVVKQTLGWKRLATGVIKIVQKMDEPKIVHLVIFSPEENIYILKQSLWKQLGLSYDKKERFIIRWTYKYNEDTTRTYGLSFLNQKRCNNFFNAVQSIKKKLKIRTMEDIDGQLMNVETRSLKVRQNLEKIKNMFASARNGNVLPKEDKLPDLWNFREQTVTQLISEDTSLENDAKLVQGNSEDRSCSVSSCFSDFFCYNNYFEVTNKGSPSSLPYSAAEEVNDSSVLELGLLEQTSTGSSHSYITIAADKSKSLTMSISATTIKESLQFSTNENSTSFDIKKNKNNYELLSKSLQQQSLGDIRTTGRTCLRPNYSCRKRRNEFKSSSPPAKISNMTNQGNECNDSAITNPKIFTGVLKKEPNDIQLADSITNSTNKNFSNQVQQARTQVNEDKKIAYKPKTLPKFRFVSWQHPFKIICSKTKQKTYYTRKRTRYIPKPSRSVITNSFKNFFSNLKTNQRVKESPFNKDGLQLRIQSQKLFGFGYLTTFHGFTTYNRCIPSDKSADESSKLNNINASYSMKSSQVVTEQFEVSSVCSVSESSIHTNQTNSISDDPIENLNSAYDDLVKRVLSLARSLEINSLQKPFESCADLTLPATFSRTKHQRSYLKTKTYTLPSKMLYANSSSSSHKFSFDMRRTKSDIAIRNTAKTFLENSIVEPPLEEVNTTVKPKRHKELCRSTSKTVDANRRNPCSKNVGLSQESAILALPTEPSAYKGLHRTEHSRADIKRTSKHRQQKIAKIKKYRVNESNESLGALMQRFESEQRRQVLQSISSADLSAKQFEMHSTSDLLFRNDELSRKKEDVLSGIGKMMSKLVNEVKTRPTEQYKEYTVQSFGSAVNNVKTSPNKQYKNYSVKSIGSADLTQKKFEINTDLSLRNDKLIKIKEDVVSCSDENISELVNDYKARRTERYKKYPVQRIKAAEFYGKNLEINSPADFSLKNDQFSEIKDNVLNCNDAAMSKSVGDTKTHPSVQSIISADLSTNKFEMVTPDITIKNDEFLNEDNVLSSNENTNSAFVNAFKTWQTEQNNCCSAQSIKSDDLSAKKLEMVKTSERFNNNESIILEDDVVKLNVCNDENVSELGGNVKTSPTELNNEYSVQSLKPADFSPKSVETISSPDLSLKKDEFIKKEEDVPSGNFNMIIALVNAVKIWQTEQHNNCSAQSIKSADLSTKTLEVVKTHELIKKNEFVMMEDNVVKTKVCKDENISAVGGNVKTRPTEHNNEYSVQCEMVSSPDLSIKNDEVIKKEEDVSRNDKLITAFVNAVKTWQSEQQSIKSANLAPKQLEMVKTPELFEYDEFKVIKDVVVKTRVCNDENISVLGGNFETRPTEHINEYSVQGFTSANISPQKVGVASSPDLPINYDKVIKKEEDVSGNAKLITAFVNAVKIWQPEQHNGSAQTIESDDLLTKKFEMVKTPEFIKKDEFVMKEDNVVQTKVCNVENIGKVDGNVKTRPTEHNNADSVQSSKLADLARKKCKMINSPDLSIKNDNCLKEEHIVSGNYNMIIAFVNAVKTWQTESLNSSVKSIKPVDLSAKKMETVSTPDNEFIKIEDVVSANDEMTRTLVNDVKTHLTEEHKEYSARSIGSADLPTKKLEMVISPDLLFKNDAFLKIEGVEVCNAKTMSKFVDVKARPTEQNMISADLSIKKLKMVNSSDLLIEADELLNKKEDMDKFVEQQKEHSYISSAELLAKIFEMDSTPAKNSEILCEINFNNKPSAIEKHKEYSVLGESMKKITAYKSKCSKESIFEATVISNQVNEKPKNQMSPKPNSVNGLPDNVNFLESEANIGESLNEKLFNSNFQITDLIDEVQPSNYVGHEEELLIVDPIKKDSIKTESFGSNEVYLLPGSDDAIVHDIFESPQIEYQGRNDISKDIKKNYILKVDKNHSDDKNANEQNNDHKLTDGNHIVTKDLNCTHKNSINNNHIDNSNVHEKHIVDKTIDDQYIAEELIENGDKFKHDGDKLTDEQHIVDDHIDKYTCGKHINDSRIDDCIQISLKMLPTIEEQNEDSSNESVDSVPEVSTIPTLKAVHVDTCPVDSVIAEALCTKPIIIGIDEQQIFNIETDAICIDNKHTDNCAEFKQESVGMFSDDQNIDAKHIKNNSIEKCIYGKYINDNPLESCIQKSLQILPTIEEQNEDSSNESCDSVKDVSSISSLKVVHVDTCPVSSMIEEPSCIKPMEIMIRIDEQQIFDVETDDKYVDDKHIDNCYAYNYDEDEQSSDAQQQAVFNDSHIDGCTCDNHINNNHIDNCIQTCSKILPTIQEQNEDSSNESCDSIKAVSTTSSLKVVHVETCSVGSIIKESSDIRPMEINTGFVEHQIFDIETDDNCVARKHDEDKQTDEQQHVTNSRIHDKYFNDQYIDKSVDYKYDGDKLTDDQHIVDDRVEDKDTSEKNEEFSTESSDSITEVYTIPLVKRMTKVESGIKSMETIIDSATKLIPPLTSGKKSNKVLTNKTQAVTTTAIPNISKPVTTKPTNVTNTRNTTHSTFRNVSKGVSVGQTKRVPTAKTTTPVSTAATSVRPKKQTLPTTITRPVQGTHTLSSTGNTRRNSKNNLLWRF